MATNSGTSKEAAAHGETTRPILKRRLTVEREDAESQRLHDITEEVCQWLSQTLSAEITHENYMEKLETGVELCRLQNKLCATLGGQEIEYHDDAEKHPQFARQNIEHFVKWCKDLGCHQLFEPNDLVVRKGMLNETREQADQNKNRRRKRVILCLHQLKKKYDTVIREGEAKASEGEEKENLTAMMVDETDSSNTELTTQAQETDHNQSDDATQSFDTPPPESDNEDKEKESSDIEETAPGESNSTPIPTAPGSNESSRVNEDEKRDGETTPTPETAVQSSNPPSMIRDYFYPALLLCIFPLVFVVGFYYLKRRK